VSRGGDFRESGSGKSRGLRGKVKDFPDFLDASDGFFARMQSQAQLAL